MTSPPQIIPRGASDPTQAPILPQFPSVDIVIDTGLNYLVLTENTRAVARLIRGLTRYVLVVTSTFPDKFSKFHEIYPTNTYWLTERSDHRSIKPNRLDFELTNAVMKFLRSHDGSCMVWIDGFETLAINNDFAHLVEFVKLVGDACSQGGHTFVLNVTPGILDASEKSSLKKKFDETFEF